jgi:hypothetical protein
MGILDMILGSGAKQAGEGVQAVLGGVGELLKDTRTAITGKDPELDARLLAVQEKINAAQAAITAAEAESESLFKSGWRPATGWICVIALGWYYFGAPLLTFFFTVFGRTPQVPALNVSELLTLLFAMLGLSGLRTMEKAKGIN